MMNLYEKVVDAVCRALWNTDLITPRITLALGELFWSIMLIWQGDTFSNPLYSNMAKIMTEECWSMLFLFSACIQMVIVTLNNLHSMCARWFAFWNMVLWFYVVTSLLSVYPPTAAIGGEIALAISALWIWLRPHILVEGYIRATR